MKELRRWNCTRIDETSTTSWQAAAAGLSFGTDKKLIYDIGAAIWRIT